MSYNPYAAPSVETYRPETPPTGTPGEPRPWTVSEVLSVGWSRMKVDGGALAVAVLVAQGIAGIPGQFPTILKVLGIVRERDAAYFPILFTCAFAGMVIGAWTQSGLVRIWLDAARGKKVEVGDVFKGGRFFLRMLGVTLCTFFATVFGLAFLLIPGIYIALGTSLTGVLVVDRDMGVFEAIGESWRLMRGQRMGVFGFWMMAFVLFIAGFLACCMGVIVVAPWIGVAGTVIYLRLSGQDDATTTVGAL